LNIGLVTAVYPDADLRVQAIALAEQLANLPPLQVKLTKRMLRVNTGVSDADAIMFNEGQAFIELIKTLKREKPLS